MIIPDRKSKPSVTQAVLSKPTQPELDVLENGIQVFSINDGKEDIIKVDFVFRAGQIFEDRPLISSTVNMMLQEGSENFSARDLNKALDYFGTVPGFFAEKDRAGLTIAFLSKHFRDILELCQEMLFRPVFPPDELENLMKKRLQWFEVRNERVQAIANDIFFEAVFGSEHPYGRMIKREDFQGITQDLLAEFHTSFYTTGNMTIIVAGKIPGGFIGQLNSLFGMMPPGKAKVQPEVITPDPGHPGKIFSEKPGAVQSAIRIGSRTINKKHPDYHGFKVTDTLIGGYFGSRLMKNIREDKGYTYGINSAVVSYELSGYKMISAEVGTRHTQNAIEEVKKEIKKMQEEPVATGELEVARNYMLGEIVRMFDGPFATADSFRAAWEFGLDYEYYFDLADKIKSITPDEIIHLARTYYKTEDLFEIIVGMK